MEISQGFRDKAEVAPTEVRKDFGDLFDGNEKVIFTAASDVDNLSDDEEAEVMSAVDKINEIKNLEDVHICNQDDVDNYVEAAVKSGHLEQVGDDQVDGIRRNMQGPDDPRMVFIIGGNYYTPSQNIFHDSISTNEAKSLIKIELIALELERRSRLLDAGIGAIEENRGNYKDLIDAFSDDIISDDQKVQLKTLLDNRQNQFVDFEKPASEEGINIKKELLDQIADIHNYIDKERLGELRVDLQEIKDLDKQIEMDEKSFQEEQGKLEAEQREKVEDIEALKEERGKSVQGKMDKIDSFEDKTGAKAEMFSYLQGIVRLDDVERPVSRETLRSLSLLGRGIHAETVNFEEFQKRSKEILIAFEADIREAPEGFAFADIENAIQSNEPLDIDNLNRNLNTADYVAFNRVMFVEHLELFTPNTNLSEQETNERDDILRSFSNRARANMVENATDWRGENEVSIPLENIPSFLLEKEPSITEVMSFLGGRDLSRVSRILFIRGGMEHFNSEGRPIDNRGETIYRASLEIARARAESNEYRALEESIEKDFKESDTGKLIEGAIEKCDRTIAANRARSWRESYLVAFGAERERRRTAHEKCRLAEREKRRVERYKTYHMEQESQYQSLLFDMQKQMQGRIDQLQPGEELDDKTLRGFRKYARKMSSEGLLKNSRTSSALMGLSELQSIKSIMKANEFGEMNDFINKNIQYEPGYQMKIDIAPEEAEERYGTTVDKQKRIFVEKFMRENGYHDLQTVSPDIQTYNRLIDKFNSEQANGVLEFMAQTNFADEVLNRDLKDAINPKSKSVKVSPAKIIDIVDRHELNQRMKDVASRRARLEVIRFTGRERWRQRFEGALRRVTNTPNAQLNDITDAAQYFEEGTGIAPSVFRGTIYTRYSVLGVLNAVGRAWETTRGAVLSPVEWVMPYSENVRHSIYESRERRAELHGNRVERLKRLDRLLAVRHGRINLTANQQELLREARSYV